MYKFAILQTKIGSKQRTMSRICALPLFFQSKSIVVTTLSHAVNKAISEQFHATATILDEAGLVTHPEWLVFALRRPRLDFNRRPIVASFCLVGDPNQLRPDISRQNTLTELEINKRGLNYSPVEVLANLGAYTQNLDVSLQGGLPRLHGQKVP